MYGIRAGRLRQVISIQSYTEAQDGYGQAIKTYSTVETVRGEVRQLSGNEEINGGQYKGRAIYQFVIRDTTLTQENRLYYNGNNFEIIEIINAGERDRYLKIKAARL